MVEAEEGGLAWSGHRWVDPWLICISVIYLSADKYKRHLQQGNLLVEPDTFLLLYRILRHRVYKGGREGSMRAWTEGGSSQIYSKDITDKIKISYI